MWYKWSKYGNLKRKKFILNIKVKLFQICYHGNCVPEGSIDSSLNYTLLECHENTCLNGGICIPVSNFYMCLCSTRFGGSKISWININTGLNF